MSKEVNGSYSDYDRQWLEAVAGRRRGEIYLDVCLSNAMANRILDHIAELEARCNTAESALKRLQTEQPKQWKERHDYFQQRIAELKAVIWADPLFRKNEKEHIQRLENHIAELKAENKRLIKLAAYATAKERMATGEYDRSDIEIVAAYQMSGKEVSDD